MNSVEHCAEALGSDSKSVLLPYYPRSSEGRTLHGEQPRLSTLVQLCTISYPDNTNTQWYLRVVVCFCCLVRFFSG